MKSQTGKHTNKNQSQFEINHFNLASKENYTAYHSSLLLQCKTKESDINWSVIFYQLKMKRNSKEKSLLSISSLSFTWNNTRFTPNKTTHMQLFHRQQDNIDDPSVKHRWHPISVRFKRAINQKIEKEKCMAISELLIYAYVLMLQIYLDEKERVGTGENSWLKNHK